MSPVSWIAIASLVLSLLTFAATQFGSRRSASASYVQQLERRVEVLETKLLEANNEITRLERENVGLMRQLVGRS